MPQIRFKQLGESGLHVSPLIIGCAGYGSKNWAQWVMDDEEEIFRILKKAYDVGLRTFDTADLYSNGTSEMLLRKFLAKFNIPRSKVVILSKVYFPINPDANGARINEGDDDFVEFEWANSRGLSRKYLFDAVAASVDRLGTYIDVLQIHKLDKSTPKTEIMRALHDIVCQGQVRYIGASSMKAVDFVQLQFIADKYNWTKFISMQNFYNLLAREEEREMIPFCHHNELGRVAVIPWSPNARGILARPLDAVSQHNRSTDTDPTIEGVGLHVLTEADREIITRVESVAKRHQVSMAVVATSWVIGKGAIPIVGINSEARVDDILGAVALQLTEDEMSYLEEPYVPKVALD
ncbi:Aldo/keto reductase [Suhomyces tanzawaensis NRRL Y-17324]|uniref:Aldo/keto reductase n=1 Tax=Suhomyces tanzawaensis NRRL Y-17324 TaxID=984487 RepID=A0A1E4SJQ1_9ASCO|nr:Aldo/keto reductase [Suhomyces tanzawaensis NRRL Y-17324]ODV79662.1 Aldo/keto reductase [Suhomyces tanzawaensis NRRL Y-17324]